MRSRHLSPDWCYSFSKNTTTTTITCSFLLHTIVQCGFLKLCSSRPIHSVVRKKEKKLPWYRLCNFDNSHPRCLPLSTFDRAHPRLFDIPGVVYLHRAYTMQRCRLQRGHSVINKQGQRCLMSLATCITSDEIAWFSRCHPIASDEAMLTS